MEGKLLETDKNNRPVNDLESLLKGRDMNAMPQGTTKVVEKYSNIRGLFEVIDGS